MLKTFINEQETFAVKENLEVQVIEMGAEKHKLLIVDNFYKNPDLVRDLAIMIPPTTNKRILTNLPADHHSGRINAFYIMDGLAPTFDHIYKTYLPETYRCMRPNAVYESFRDATFIVNVMTSENLPACSPHVDFPYEDVYAALIYLNTPEECKGGTGFYSFNGLMKGFSEWMDAEKTIKPDHFIVDSVGGWKLEYLAEMKFNRMVLYPQAVYHTAYIKPGMYTGDNYRINQVFFI